MLTQAGPQSSASSAHALMPPSFFKAHRILIAANDSSPAAWAVKTAERLAGQFECDLEVVHAAPPPAIFEAECEMMYDQADAAREAEAKDFLEALTVQAAKGHAVRKHLRRGYAVDQIVGAAQDTRADLVVMGTHAYRGLKRLALGSVASGVVRTAPCPVLSVSRPPADTFGQRILVAVDDDEPSKWAVDWACNLAWRTGGEIMLFHAVPLPVLIEPGYGLVSADIANNLHGLADKMLSRLELCLPPATRVHRILRDGPAGPGIAAEAEGWKADLIVMGMTGHGAVYRTVLGSSTESVLRHAQCPVLCIGHNPRAPA